MRNRSGKFRDQRGGVGNRRGTWDQGLKGGESRIGINEQEVDARIKGMLSRIAGVFPRLKSLTHFFGLLVAI